AGADRPRRHRRLPRPRRPALRAHPALPALRGRLARRRDPGRRAGLGRLARPALRGARARDVEVRRSRRPRERGRADTERRPGFDTAGLRLRFPAMSEVFISYARGEARTAEKVADALRALGYEVWRDDELPPHRGYAEVIEERIDAAKAVLVLWSPEAT